MPDDQREVEELESLRSNRRLSMTSAYSRPTIGVLKKTCAGESTDEPVADLARGSGAGSGGVRVAFADDAGTGVALAGVGSGLADATTDVSADQMETMLWSEKSANGTAVAPNGGVPTVPLPGLVQVEVDSGSAATEPAAAPVGGPVMSTALQPAKEGMVALRSETRMMREVIALRTDTRAVVAAAKDEIVTTLELRLESGEWSNRQMALAIEGLRLQLVQLQAMQTAAPAPSQPAAGTPSTRSPSIQGAAAGPLA